MINMKSKKVIILIIIIVGLISIGIPNDENTNSKSSNPPTVNQLQPTTYNNLNSSLQQYRYQRSSETQSSLNREEVLKKTLKGYREQTYWGNEHPITETTKHLNDREFNRFEKEIKSKDADVFWGAEY